MSFFDSILEIVVGIFAKSEVSVSIPVGQSAPKEDSPRVWDTVKPISFILTHTRFCPDGIFGELTKEDGTFVAYTVEHSYENKPKLVDGEYTCVRGIHHLGPELKEINTFEIKGIPPFQGHDVTGILFHPGNNGQSESSGCALMGSAITNNMVINSRATWQAFMKSLEGINSFQLSVK